MSLVVWLPLTKDLRQQGLSDVEVTNNGVAFNSAGKLGGTYSSTTSGQTIVLNLSNLSTMLANGKTYSLACWVKPTGTPSNGWVIKLGDNTCGLWWAKSAARWVWNENDNGKRCANETISSDYTNWHHLAIIVDKTVSGKITTKQYVDGELANGYPGTTWDSSSHSQPTGTTITISPYVALLNDIRLYDHCLSPMEVKELAKGLVLHYPLNREGWGQENLVWNSNWNTHSTIPPESWVNWGSPPTREIVTIDGKNWLHVISNTTQFQGYSQNWTKRNGVGELTANTKMTVSFTAKLAAAASIAPIGIHWCNSSGTIVTQNWTTTALTTSPKRYSFTYTTPADCVAFNIMVGDNTNTAHEVWVTDIKLEFGEIATPWCPNSSDILATTMGLNSTTEYDCSGFCNNGIKNNVPIYLNDTAKYSVSTHLNGTNQTIQIPNLSTLIKDEVFTFNIWFKRLQSEPSSKAWETIFGGPSGFEIETCSANNVHDNKIKAYSWGSSTFEFEFDKWNMLTLVRTVSDSKFYLNGELKLTGSKGSIPSGNYFIGSWNTTTQQNYKGYVSDARIYATALSADDVRALYENSAYIDNSGNTYAATYTEV